MAIEISPTVFVERQERLLDNRSWENSNLGDRRFINPEKETRGLRRLFEMVRGRRIKTILILPENTNFLIFQAST